MSKQFFDQDDFFDLYSHDGQGNRADGDAAEQPSSEETLGAHFAPADPTDAVRAMFDANGDAAPRTDASEADGDFDREIFSTTEREEAAHAAHYAAVDEKPRRGRKGEAVRMGKPKKKHRVRGAIGRVILSIFLIGIITVCLVVGAFSVYVFAFVDAKLDFDLNNLKLDYTSVIFAPDPEKEDGYYELAQIHGIQNRIWVDYDDLSPYLGDAVVAIEDKRFYDHDGIDWKRTFSAFVNMFVDIYGNTQGGSTITQQLVKNLTGDDERTPVRKIQEIMRARYVEGNYSKTTILECYINTVHFGKGCDGIQTAAQYYFGKSAKDLTLLECAALAATIQSPSVKNPITGPEKNKERRELVLKEMLNQGSISQEEYDQALSEELVVVTTGEKDAETKATGVNSYYVDTVIEEIIDRLIKEKGYTTTQAETVLYTGGLQIYSAYDAKVQKALDDTFADNSNFLRVGSGDTQPQSAITVMDYSGHIVGIVGGRGEKPGKRDLNRATMSKRQPGSCMKPIGAYGPSVEFNLVTYSTIMQDSAITLADGSRYPPRGGSGSSVYLYNALERSLNAVAVRLVNKLSPQKSFDFVTGRLGISTLVSSEKTASGKILSDVNLSAMALGGCTYGVRVHEMCAAYATFGNLGRYYEPTTFTKVTDTFGDVVFEQQDGKPVFGEDTAYIMNKMMQRVIAGSQGTGTSGRIGEWPLYGKTGTTNDNKDRWFIGGSPYYVAACWFGFDNPKAMYGLSTNPALKVWRAAMSKIHDGLEIKDFPETPLVSRRYYCTDTGMLATSGCSNKSLGWFKNSYLPACSHGGSLLDPLDSSSSGGSSSSSTTSTTQQEEPVSSTAPSSAPASSAPASSSPASSRPASSAPASSQSTPSVTSSHSEPSTISTPSETPVSHEDPTPSETPSPSESDTSHTTTDPDPSAPSEPEGED